MPIILLLGFPEEMQSRIGARLYQNLSIFATDSQAPEMA